VKCESADSLTLCLQMLHNLLQVVSAFHIGRGGMSMSYMGRGVTRGATLCLRHLAYEMATHLQSKDWPRNWLFSRQATPDSVGESGFHWLTPLWSYRDAEVRVAGVGIAVALTTTEAGRITMTTQCQHITGGIWGAAFGILLDQAECSLVREQAALLLVNLTSQTMPTGNVENEADVWQGPIVRNEDTRVSLMGLPALLALLHHSHFYKEMSVLLNNYYPQPAIHPVSVAGGPALSSKASSQATMTTSGSVTPGGSASLLQASRISTPSNRMTSTPMSEPSERLSRAIMRDVGTQQGSSRTTSSLSVMPQGDDSSESSHPADVVLQDYESVATHCLVSGVCQLLSNLVTMAPQDTLYSINTETIPKILISMLDSAMLDAYTTELKTTHNKAQYLTAFRNLLRLHKDVIHLLKLCIEQDKSIFRLLVSDTVAVKQLVMILSIVEEDDVDTSALCEQLWESVMTLLITFIQLGGHETLLEMSPVLTRHWHIIAGRCVTILQSPKEQESQLWTMTLHFLSVLLSTEGKLQLQRAQGLVKVECTITNMLDIPPGSESDLFSGSSGAELCQTLIKAFDSVAHRTQDQAYTVKVAVINAVKSLLAVSAAAKTAALEDGMAESLCEHIKRLHVRLNMEALEMPQAMANQAKKKDQPVISELIIILDLLRNFMYQQQEVKVAAYESGLSSLLHKLWSWAQIEASLMSSMLPLLATYVARCPQACSSLASTSAVAITDRPVAKAPNTTSSLVHCLLKLVQKETTQGNIAVLKSTYAILSTLSLSQECRGVLWKSNFVHDFSTLTIILGKGKKSKLQRSLEGLWLDLLVNLSFSTDGQNMILKITDAMTILMEYAVSGSEHLEKCAILIIRNLGFHSSNKSKLLANDKFLPVLLRCVESGSDDVRSIASSAIYALVFNSQKAKVSMKSHHVIRKLQECYNNVLRASEATPTMSRCAENIHDTLTLLRS
jgi:rotatin